MLVALRNPLWNFLKNFRLAANAPVIPKMLRRIITHGRIIINTRRIESITFKNRRSKESFHQVICEYPVLIFM
jgi:hypothetical protein